MIRRPLSRVEQHRADQPDLDQVDERVLVGLDDDVVALGRHPDQRGVQHVANRKKNVKTPVIR